MDRIQLPREIIHENAKALTSQVENIASNASSLYGRNIVIDIQNNAKWYKEVESMSKLIFLGFSGENLRFF